MGPLGVIDGGRDMEEVSRLVRAALEGRSEAFDALVLCFQDMAFAGAYARLGDRELAQDAAQEAFVDAYLSLGYLREPAAFPGWFRGFVVKHADRIGRRRRLTWVEPSALEAVASPWPSPADLVDQQEQVDSVQQAVSTLPPGQREAVLLHYLQGYSQRDVAAYLGVAEGAVRKRLFDARQRLAERMTDMAVKEPEAKMQSEKPDAGFAHRVGLFIALRQRDVARVRELVQQHPELVGVTFEWGVGSEGHFWPVGMTPTGWAAATGNEGLLNVLLKQGGDAQVALGAAVELGQLGVVRALLVRDDVEVTEGMLFMAVLRNRRDLLETLLEADEHATPSSGKDFTPLEWATIKGYRDLVDLLRAHGGAQPRDDLPIQRDSEAPMTTTPSPCPAGSASLGRVLEADGAVRDGDVPLEASSRTRPLRSGETAAVLETGIKVLDLAAPFRRGGHMGWFCPTPGVGKLLVLGELCQNFLAMHDGMLVYLGVESAAYRAEDLRLAWRGDCLMNDDDIDERMVFVFTERDRGEAGKMDAAELGLGLAEDLRSQGREVLAIVESELAMGEGVSRVLRSNAGVAPGGAITTVYVGDHTPGLEPQCLAGLDAVAGFDIDRARQGLYPAIDPVNSNSTLLGSALEVPGHGEVSGRARDLLRRYVGLHGQYERQGAGAFFHLDDPADAERTALRARRLNRFLTQPFYVAERFTGVPGVRVPLKETLEGCRQILDGEYDDLPEDAFHFVGSKPKSKDGAKKRGKSS